jgi:hypothetical protein
MGCNIPTNIFALYLLLVSRNKDKGHQILNCKVQVISEENIASIFRVEG